MDGHNTRMYLTIWDVNFKNVLCGNFNCYRISYRYTNVRLRRWFQEPFPVSASHSQTCSIGVSPPRREWGSLRRKLRILRVEL